MDIFEYNEVRWPTRALQQEEEEEAMATALQHLQLPTIEWREGVQPLAKAQLLVVVMSPASCALLEACLAAAGGKEVAVVRSASSSATNADETRTAAAAPSTGSVATLYSADEHAGVLVCCCSRAVRAEQAPAWARGLMQELQPQRLLMFGSMQVEQYRGEADPSQEFVAFLLQSSSSRQAVTGQQQQEAPYLPSGSLVAGLPAALVSQAELHGVPADLLVVVDMVPALVPVTLHDLSELMVKAVRRAAAGGDAGAGWVLQLQEPAVLNEARTKLHQTTCRPTSVYS